MSSALRTTSTSVGLFVLSADVVLDGSQSGIYELSSAAVYANDGTVSTAAVFGYVDPSDLLVGNGVFVGLDTAATGRRSVTLKDLGVTEYGAYVTSKGSATQLGPVDLRKVQLVGGGINGALTNGTYVNNPFYVSLGTNLRSGTPSSWVSTVGSSVALVGKLL